MSIVKTISESEFLDEFVSHNRADNFSYYAKLALYEHYDTYGDDWENEEPYDLDIIEICSTWTECKTKELTIFNYGYLIDDMFELEKEFREDNDIDATYDINDDTYEKFFVESLDTEWEKELNDFVFDTIVQELEDNAPYVVRIEETNTIDPSMNVDGVLVYNF